MRKLTLLCAWLCAIALVVIVAADPAQATGTNPISYVSNTGNDGNNCSAPATACQTFNGALGKTANYGEIDCVNAGFYTTSPVTISQSVTIDCAGGVGSVINTVTVNGAGIVVRLRNLSLNRIGSGDFAIDAQSMAALYIENCVISNANAAVSPGTPYIGVKFEPSAGASALFITNSIISNNGNSGSVSGGIDIVPAMGATADVSIDHSQINGNVFGIIADGTGGGIIKGTITDSVVSGNSENGITVSSSGSSVVFQIDRTTVAKNFHGLVAGGSGAGMLVSNTNVFNNTAGLFTTNGGTLYSYSNNHVNGNNGNDGTFTGTISQQ